MKKLAIGTLTALVFASGAGLGSQQAEAAITKPSQLKDGVKSYQAVVIKNAKVYAFKGNKSYTLKKGTPITIVEKIDYEKYHLLTLKGQKYMKVNDSTVKIKKALKGKTNYHKFQLSDMSKEQLKELGKNHKDYKNFKNYLINHELPYYYRDAELLKELINMNLYTNDIFPLDGSGAAAHYTIWENIGKPVYHPKIKKTWITE